MWANFLALIPVLWQTVYGVYKQETSNPASGQGTKKKQNLLTELLSFVTNSNIVGKLLGDNQNPTMILVGEVADALVKWANATKTFKTTHELDTTPTGEPEGGGEG